jgi:hypothetical protein
VSAPAWTPRVPDIGVLGQDDAHVGKRAGDHSERTEKQVQYLIASSLAPVLSGRRCEVRTLVANDLARSGSRLRVAAGFRAAGCEECRGVTALLAEAARPRVTRADEVEVLADVRSS